MSTAMEQAFQAFKSNLEITGLAADTVSERQRHVRKSIAKDFIVLDAFPSGSYRRKTMIAPLDEAAIEFCLVLDSRYYCRDQNGPMTLLERIKETLQKHCNAATAINSNGQAATLAFPDFDVDVVPAVPFQGSSYLIPDARRQRWVSTDPDKQIEIWTSANEMQGDKLIPLIKMIKAWNKRQNKLLRSFHLESLALQVFTGVPVAEYWHALADFFVRAAQHVDYVPDPSGQGGNLAYYLDFSRAHVVKDRMKEARWRAIEAITLDDFGKTDRAFAKWRDIFGDYFPPKEEISCARAVHATCGFVTPLRG
jgi:hypothetical protein